MTSNKGKRKREEKRSRRKQRQREEEEVVRDSATALTCSTEAADDMAGVCDHLLEELEFERIYMRLALEIWGEHSELAKPLKAVVADLLAASETYNDALLAAGRRLECLADDPAPAVQLKDIERYRQLVRQRLFPPD